MTNRTQKLISEAKRRGQNTLSEYESKLILSSYGIPTSKEKLVTSVSQARSAAKTIGYPIVLKACSPDESHKTEKALIAVNISSQKELNNAWNRLKKKVGEHYSGSWLVQEMVNGQREVMIGMHRDAGFGPSVMFGLGGIFTELLQDVVFRVAPLRKKDAREMLRSIKAQKILNAVRGMPAADREVLVHALMAVGQIAIDHPEISEIDINPLILRGAKAVAVDGLIVLAKD